MNKKKRNRKKEEPNELTEPKKTIKELTENADEIQRKSGWIKGIQEDSQEQFDDLLEKIVKEADNDKKEKE